MSVTSCVYLLATLCLLTISISSSNGQCPIPEANLDEYIERSNTVFSTALQAAYQAVPGSPLGAIRVTWGLTDPDCIRTTCVRVENTDNVVLGSIQCYDGGSTNSSVIDGLPCNVEVKAILELTAGVSGRSVSSNAVYIGGDSRLSPSAPPPNVRAYLDNNEVVLTWDELECSKQNSKIRFYRVLYRVVGEENEVAFTLGPVTMIRSSRTQMDNKIIIPDLSKPYQFEVRVVGNAGFSLQSDTLEVIPANLDPIPTEAPTTIPPTTTPPPTTLPPTTQPPQTTQPPPQPPPTTPPPPPTPPPTRPPTPPSTQTTTARAPTTPTSQATPKTTPTTGSDNSTTTLGPASTDPREMNTQDPARDGIIGVVVGVMVGVTIVLLTLSGIILGWMIWRHRVTFREWRASKKRLSISGPIAVNDMFVEVKRDSQLLEAESKRRETSRKGSMKKKDKNIYDELEASEPKIRHYKRNVHVGGGEQVTLKVEFTGFPKPSIDWFYEGMRLDANSLNGREVLNDGSIFIKEADRKHTGTYDFIVSNSLGSVEGCTKLIVYVEEKVDSATVDRRKKNGTKLESHMVKKEKFSRHVSHCHTFNNKGFTAEFQSLLTWEEEERTTVGRTGENRFKNRYKNITPYDKNRLTLEPMNHPECQYDYINASYIDGYSKPKRYIAAQGPLPTTLLDFWRLIWQEGVQTIAMVTSLQEGRHKMCEQYWPDSGCVEYGPFMVTLVETQVFADYVIRTFQLLTSDQSVNSRNIRKVTHYQFLSWPDHGIPDHPGPLLAYLRRIKSNHKPTKGPILVHCSAGVGRTGTLVTIDTAIGQAAQEDVIDIAGIVCRIRSQRMQMVQTPEQYAFIHDAVLEAITCGDTQIPASGFKRALAKLADKKNDKEPTGFEKQFETLETVSPQARDVPRTVALRCSSKNRSNEYLPSDGSRVWLQAQNMDKTYIHASYINGYKQKNGYIIAQAPMENTTEDFWRMVYERDCAVIVMLSGMEELGEECCYCYWPDSQAKSAINGEKHGTHTIFTLERKREEGFLVRTFGITDPKGENMRRVVQFQMAGWSQDGVCINPVALMKMLDKLLIAQRRTGDKPIIVHGSNTVSRCAVFCALLNCIDSCKCESIVDVFQTIKALRLQKPGAIQTVEQYSCVYELLSLYLNSFSLYSNFK